jgi:hypothetical protein
MTTAKTIQAIDRSQAIAAEARQTRLNLPKAKFDVTGVDGAKCGIFCNQISTALKMSNPRAHMCWEGKDYLLERHNSKQFAFDEAAQAVMTRLADSGAPSADGSTSAEGELLSHRTPAVMRTQRPHAASLHRAQGQAWVASRRSNGT